MGKSGKPDRAFIARALVAGEVVLPESITVGDGWHREMPGSVETITVEITREVAFTRFEAYYKRLRRRLPALSAGR